MKSKLITTMFLFLIACLTATTAMAQSPHYKKFPSCVDNGLQLVCTGALSGLGNFNVEVLLTGQGTVHTVCTAPGSGNESPGQNPALNVNLSGLLILPAPDNKNGNQPFTVSTLVPTTPTPAQAGCANNNWGVRITNVDFTTGTFRLTVLQDLNSDGVFTAATETVINAVVVF
jgi:hypothetical protein